MGIYHVTEHFISINGEAQRAGELSCFIRLAGCNLCCNYCDTRWSCDPEAPAEQMAVEEIYAWVKDSGVANVTLTGGEPLLDPAVKDLLQRLGEDPALRTEIETNGSVDLKPFGDIPGNISFTMDLKCPGSGMAEHNRMENLELLRPQDTVKFVVSDRDDLDWMREQVEHFRLTERCRVYISPVFGRIHPQEIVEYMKEYVMNDVRVQLQLHKYIWDPQKKGV